MLMGKGDKRERKGRVVGGRGKAERGREREEGGPFEKLVGPPV